MHTFNKQWKTAGMRIKGRVIPRLCVSGAFRSCSWTLRLLRSLIRMLDEEAGRLRTSIGLTLLFLRFADGKKLAMSNLWKLRVWGHFRGSRASCRLPRLPGWRRICSHRHCSLAELPGEREPPSAPAASFLVAGSYCRVRFVEKIKQFKSISEIHLLLYLWFRKTHLKLKPRK